VSAEEILVEELLNDLIENFFEEWFTDSFEKMGECSNIWCFIKSEISSPKLFFFNLSFALK
jgi:hypothetical protein